MTITTRGWLNIVLVSLGAVIAVGVVLGIKYCNAPKPDVIAWQDSAQYFKNHLGQEVSAIKQREQDFYRVKEAGWLDSIAKLNNTKTHLLLEVTTLKQKGTVTITVPSAPIIVVKKDTVPGECPVYISVQETFSNPYYKASVSVNMDGSDSSRMHLETFDSLSFVVKTVKEGGLFNRQSYIQVNASNANPYNHISGLQVYRQPLPKQKRFGVGPAIGYGLGGSPVKPSIIVGVVLQYNIIRF